MDDPFPSQTDIFPVQDPWRAPAEWRDQLGSRRALDTWLGLTGSLTRALREACPAGVDLRIHRRSQAPVPASGASLLGIGASEPVWLREVWLLCGEAAVVFARSWIPDGVLPDPGEYPLGDRLFEPDSGVDRVSLEAAPVTGPDGSTLWARRSLHASAEGRLMVGEVFLPAMDNLL